MRAIHVTQLRPGLVLGRPLLDERGNTLLNRGVTLTHPYIRSLADKGFEQVYVRDPEAEFDVEPEEDLDPATRAKALTTLQEAYTKIEKEVQSLRTKSVEAVTEACGSDSVKTLMGSNGPLAKVMGVVNQILDEVLSRANLAGLATISTADSQLHDHSINVCVVSIMIARAVGVPERSLRPLAAGCLLHDLGMVFVEPGTAEIKRMRQHTLLGYELLRQSEDPGILAPHVALEHHEHQDGTGQPRRTRSSNVLERDRNLPPPIPTLIGEIAAVANFYDNRLSGRGGEALTPDAIIHAVRDVSGTVLNRTVVTGFLRCVPVYPVGAEIIVKSDRLRNYTGVVSAINAGQFDRPVIVLTRDNRRQVIPPETLDLKEENDLEIQCRSY